MVGQRNGVITNIFIHFARIFPSSTPVASCPSASTAAQHQATLFTSSNYFNFILIILQPTCVHNAVIGI